MTASDLLLECARLQEDEIKVVESIYPESIRIGGKGHVELDVPVEFQSPHEVVIHRLQSQGSTPDTTHLSLTALPPLLLHLALPSDYPLRAAPEIVSCRTSQSWLPRVTQLQSRLMAMWKPGETVLYDWIEHLRTGDFLGSLEMLNGNGISISHPVPNFLAKLLATYDGQASSQSFMSSTYPCSICLNEHKGSKCIRLNCSHIFCRSCLEDFWGLCITEGDVDRVGCPEPSCVKAKREATEDEVSQVATEEQVVRWKWLREKRAFDKDPGTVSCPIPCCQSLIASPPTSTEDSGWARLRECSKCGFSFCSFCKRSWHGPVTSCPISAVESLIIEYRALPEGSLKRTEIESRLGKTMFNKLMAKYEEELANMKWLEASTRACPKCNVHVEKSLGCNHMTCARCSQHFCYRCGTKLNPANPYKHFSSPGTSCFNKLFDAGAGDDDEWEAVELALT